MKNVPLKLPLVLFHKIKVVAAQQKTSVENAAIFLVEGGRSTPSKKQRKTSTVSLFLA